MTPSTHSLLSGAELSHAKRWGRSIRSESAAFDLGIGILNCCIHTFIILCSNPCPNGCERWTTHMETACLWVSPVLSILSSTFLCSTFVRRLNMGKIVVKPNRNVPVLIHCRKDCGEITLEALVFPPHPVVKKARQAAERNPLGK